MTRPTLFERMSQVASPARAPRRLSPELLAVLERVEGATLGLMLEQSPARRELVSRRLIFSRRMNAGHRSKYYLTEEGRRSLEAARA